jgi:hypothetical protein
LTLILFAGPGDSVAVGAQSLNSIVHRAAIDRDDLRIGIYLIEQTPDGRVDEATMLYGGATTLIPIASCTLEPVCLHQPLAMIGTFR